MTDSATLIRWHPLIGHVIGRMGSEPLPIGMCYATVRYSLKLYLEGAVGCFYPGDVQVLGWTFEAIVPLPVSYLDVGYDAHPRCCEVLVMLVGRLGCNALPNNEDRGNVLFAGKSVRV